MTSAEFYDRIARETEDAAIRRIAEELVEEERGHIAMVSTLLDRHPELDADWSADMDPPGALE